jgi:hypothetical protein
VRAALHRPVHLPFTAASAYVPGMGDRADRARAWRGMASGIVFGVLALIGTAAIAVAIPTQGENPRAWGTVGCGLVTVWLCGRLAVRNRQLLRHYRGDDLPLPARPSPAPPAALDRHRHVVHERPSARRPRRPHTLAGLTRSR